jgi:hypothetical protein
MQSLFYYLAVPTTAAMELVRLVRLQALAPRTTKVEVITTLLLDRAIGASSALLLFVLSGFRLTARLPASTTVYLAIGITLCGVIVVALGVALLRQWLRDTLTRVAEVGARSGWRLIYIFGLGIVIQATSVLAVHIGALGLGAHLPLAATAWGVLGVIVLTVIPLTFAGLGPAEVGSTALMLASAVDRNSVILVVFLAYLGRAVGGLQGAIFEIQDGLRG